MFIGSRPGFTTTKLQDLDHELISLEELKHFLRIEGNYDDAIIKTFMQYAFEVAENHIAKILSPKTFIHTIFDAKSNIIKLLNTPVISINSIKLGNNILHSQNYFFIQNTQAIQINNTQLNNQQLDVTYTSGLTNPIELPAIIKLTIMQHVAFLYDSKLSDNKTPPNFLNAYNIYHNVKI